jgi:hypothetical protein
LFGVSPGAVAAAVDRGHSQHQPLPKGRVDDIAPHQLFHITPPGDDGSQISGERRKTMIYAAIEYFFHGNFFFIFYLR